MTLASPEQVLTTLSSDGSRCWIKPRVSTGRFLTLRRLVAWFLIALFFTLPFLQATFPYIGLPEHPLFRLDILERKFTLFGYTFLPTDTFLLALGMLFFFVSIFLFTAIFGRLWCGWACPQTVYMEFLYRPLERLFEGTAGRGGPARKNTFPRKIGYFLVALFATILPVHTFLAYFVGVRDLSQWVHQSPFQHPTAFLVMAVTTGLMMFDFYWFREQLCLIACPYGRFQSVLLDKLSLIVTYDKTRGEPRGKRSPGSKALGSESHTHSLRVLPQGAAQDSTPRTQDSPHGDCVDCRLCVSTCPTGIDIREGLQMECVNCTQCIDACDAVMDKLKRPRGLIRYSSQAAMEASAAGTPRPRRLRFRVIFYPVILAILALAWLAVFLNKGAADLALFRNSGAPYSIVAGGNVANPLRLKITNRTGNAVTYTFAFADFPEARLDVNDNTVTVPAGQSVTIPFVAEAPPSAFANGRREAWLIVSDRKTYSGKVLVRLLGPTYSGTSSPDKNEVKP